MFAGARVAVVIPAFNEASKIIETVRSVPPFVDHVLVVDDASSDGTAFVAAREARTGLEIILHARNRGVGAAIMTGYRRALALRVDAVAVMAGDGQMHPDDLPALLEPVVFGHADYAKGNRLGWPGVATLMPAMRRLGNLVLSWITRRTAGYPDLRDSQCGYTVASRDILGELPLEQVWPRYGYPNDLLGRLGAIGARVRDVPVRPVYAPGWRSGIRPWMVVYPFAFVLARSLLWRLVLPARAPRACLTPLVSASAPASHGSVREEPPPEIPGECASAS